MEKLPYRLKSINEKLDFRCWASPLSASPVCQRPEPRLQGISLGGMPAQIGTFSFTMRSCWRTRSALTVWVADVTMKFLLQDLPFQYVAIRLTFGVILILQTFLPLPVNFESARLSHLP